MHCKEKKSRRISLRLCTPRCLKLRKTSWSKILGGKTSWTKNVRGRNDQVRNVRERNVQAQKVRGETSWARNVQVQKVRGETSWSKISGGGRNVQLQNVRGRNVLVQNGGVTGPKCRGEMSCPKSQGAKRPGPKRPGAKTLPEPDCETSSMIVTFPEASL